MNLSGTPFQIKVWNELKKIPSGETRTYKQIAESIGHPNRQEQLLMHAQKILILQQFHAIELFVLMEV